MDRQEKRMKAHRERRKRRRRKEPTKEGKNFGEG